MSLYMHTPVLFYNIALIPPPSIPNSPLLPPLPHSAYVQVPLSQSFIWTDAGRAGVADETDLPLTPKARKGKKAKMVVRASKGDKANAARQREGTKASESRRRQTVSSSKQSLMGGGTLGGEAYAPMTIYKAAKLKAEWTKIVKGGVEVRFFMTTNGQNVDAYYDVSPSGGMTEATFKAWIDNIVIPSHPSLFAFLDKATIHCNIRGKKIIINWTLKVGVNMVPDQFKVVLLADGDYSHIVYANLVYIATFMKMKPPPPYSSGRTQSGDARNGTNQAVKDSSWPTAQANRQGWLSQHGVIRPLDRTDVPIMMAEAYQSGFSRRNQNSANNTVGLVPYSRRPKYEADIQATKDDVSVTDKCQLDIAKIQYFVDKDELEKGGEELARQLSGSKWGTGKMARYCSTDPAFLMVAGLSHQNATAAKKKKADQAAATAAKKAAAPALKAAKEAKDAEVKKEKAENKRKKEENKVLGDAAKKKKKVEDKKEKVKSAKTLKQQQTSVSSLLASMTNTERENFLAAATQATHTGNNGIGIGVGAAKAKVEKRKGKATVTGKKGGRKRVKKEVESV